MFKTKSPKSSLLFSQYLLVTSLLLASCLSYKCVEKQTLSKDDQELVDNLLTLFETKNGLISVGEFSKMYIYPTDTTKVVKIQKVPKKYTRFLDSIDITQAFSDKDAQLAGNPRFVPNLVKSFCVNRDHDVKLVIFIQERFRGNMKTATTKDQRFVTAMAQFSERMKFYGNMLSTYGQIPKLKYKHCEITPENFLYLENNADWSADYAKGQGPLSYFPVVTDFGLTIGWGSKCPSGDSKFADPEDYGDDIKFLDKIKAKVEIYSMALVIFYMENNILQKLAQRSDPSDEIIEKLSALTGQSDPFGERFGINNPYTEQTLPEVFQELLNLHGEWNSNSATYDHDLLKYDLEFIISGMDVYNEYLLKGRGANEDQTYNLRVQYQEFTRALTAMVGKNNSTIDQRPTNDEIIQKFAKIQTDSLAIEQTIGQRRSLLVI